MLPALLFLSCISCVSGTEPLTNSSGHIDEETAPETTASESPVLKTGSLSGGEQPVTEEEILAVHSALARADAIDAASVCPEEMRRAQEAYDSALSLRESDPASSRALLSAARDEADRAFDIAQAELRETIIDRLDGLLEKLRDIDADAYVSDEYAALSAQRDEVTRLFDHGEAASAIALGEKTEKSMEECYTTLNKKIDTVTALKQEVEKVLDESEGTGIFACTSLSHEEALRRYFEGMAAFGDHDLDKAAEAFSEAHEYCLSMITEAETRKIRRTNALKKTEVLDLLAESSGFSVVTEDRTLTGPVPFDSAEFLAGIDTGQDETEEGTDETEAVSRGSMQTDFWEHIPVAKLFGRAQTYLRAGIVQEESGNDSEAARCFDAAYHLISRYRRYAVHSLYTVKDIPLHPECLWNIAGHDEVYGNPFLWPLIWRWNRDLIPDPRLIYPGQSLIIPLSPEYDDKKE